MQRLCLTCRQSYEAQRDYSQYCSGRCRIEASRKRKAKTQAERNREVRGLLQEALRVLKGGPEGG